MKKRLLSLTLALALCLGLAVPALAADTAAAKEVADGEYTLARQGTGEFMERELRTGYKAGDGLGDETTVAGYYGISPDAAWTVQNTSANEASLVGISMNFYVPVGNNAYMTIAGGGVLIDRNGQIGGNTANGRNWEELDKLCPGDSVTFTLADVLADEETAEIIGYINELAGRGAGETDGIVLSLQITQEFTDSYDFANDSYYYMANSSSTETPVDPNPAQKFTDVKPGDWFYEPVQWAVENNITAGTSATTFSPDMTCTTAQILTFLWRANGSPEPKAGGAFNDVSSSDYFYKAALWAKEKELVSGDTFNGNTPCTRSATVTYLWKLAGRPAASGGDFTDVPAESDYAQAVAWAVENGVTSGTSQTTFSPGATCTRGQIVTFLYRDMAK